MQQLKNFSRLSFLLMMIVAGLLAFNSTTQATNFKPYEYTFETPENLEVVTQTFNGIKGIKNLVITFDNASLASSIVTGDLDDITVVKVAEAVAGTAATPVNIVDSVNLNNNVATIQFKNLDYIDYTGAQSVKYELTINGSSGQYVFPFAVHDILPGFESIFLGEGQAGTNQINKIFEDNPPRDIYVHIPKYYLNKIETIHRHNGVVVDVAASTLTNIDVLTDDAVTRLKVDLDKQLIRDLAPHPSVKGFTMGYASGEKLEVDDLKEFSLQAYDRYGRLLDSTKFKINYINEQYLDSTRIKVSNYITKKASDFGKTYTLYDLMSKPKIFENILTSLSKDDLNKIGVTYENQLSEVGVGDIDQLNSALLNPKIRTINLAGNIDATGGLVINSNITINGNNHTITGDVKLANGTAITLKDLIITGNLIVDPGDEATVIAENVTAAGVEIVSGGIHSIHLTNFKAINGLTFNNISPVRVVLTNSGLLNVTLNRDQEVILEGHYGTIISTDDDAKLTLTSGSTIDGLAVNGAKLTVTHPPSILLPENRGSGELVVINSEETDPGSGNNNNVEPLGMTSTVDIMQNGAINLEGNINLSGINTIAILVNWEVSDANIFGSGRVYVSEDKDKIVIENLAILTEESMLRNVTLIGEYNGKKYSLVVPVKVTK